MTVRVRMAPSPSGDLHVGNARTALFNWLFARKNSGKYILRIEDTDSSRSTEESIASIEESLKWLGLAWDEGPFRQSQRYEYYRTVAEDLVRVGAAYWCYSSPDEMELERQAFMATRKKSPHPDRFLTPEQRQQKVAEGRVPALRFIVDGEGAIGFNDLVRGEVVTPLAEINDFNLMKSDGSPMYNFAVVADDHAMAISHVIRGEDGISNTPRQLLIYRALGWEPPKFGHVSFILGPDHTKLSKSHGATSVGEFRRKGYLPEALLNYLGLLGMGGHGEGSEILSLEDLTRNFSFENLVKSAAVFDYGKLNFLNAHYLRSKPSAELAELAAPFLREAGVEAAGPRLQQALEVVRGNAQLLSDLPGQLGYLFGMEPQNGPGALALFAGAKEALSAFRERLLASAGIHTAEEAKVLLKSAQVASGLKGKDFFMPVRMALCGMEHGPELINLLPLMDKATCLKRVESALGSI